MSSTALGAEKAAKIIFISKAHEKFYYEKLKEVRYQDVYHKARNLCDNLFNWRSISPFPGFCIQGMLTIQSFDCSMHAYSK